MKPQTQPNAIDWKQARVLLRLFFKLNARGHLAKAMNRRGGDKNWSILWIFLMYGCFGLFLGMMAFMPGMDPFSWALLAQTMTFLLCGMTAILESSEILFNPLEEDVLGHQPIGPRTLVVAKMLNLAGITGLIGLALNLIPIFCAWWLRGSFFWMPLAHLLSVLLTALFCAAAMVFIYGLVTWLVGREKFQTLVTWAQIMMIVVFSLGYQVVPRLLQKMQGVSADRYLIYLIPFPPAWFAALESSLGTRGSSPALWPLAGVALGATLLLARSAAVRLAAMQRHVTGSLLEKSVTAAPEKAERALRPVRLNPLLRGWLRDPVERAVFRLAASYLRRDRFTMQQIYPQLAFAFIYPIIMLLNRSNRGFPSSFFMFFGLWFVASFAPMAIEILRCSENCAAAELFAVAPLAGSGPLFHGVRKAALYYLTLPGAAVIMLFFYIFSENRAADLTACLPLIAFIPLLSLIPGLGRDYIPFSQPPRTGRQASRMGLMFASMALMGAILGLTHLAKRYGLVYALLGLELPLVALAYWAMLARINRRNGIRWKE